MAFTIWWCALAAPIMLARWRLRYFSIDAERVEVNQRTTVLRVDREDDLYEQGIEGIDLDKKDCSGRQSPAIEGNNWHLNVLSKTERLFACAVGLAVGSVTGFAVWAAAYTIIGFAFQQASGYPYFLWW